MKYLVYMHTSKTTGKSYIGVTSQTSSKRLARHYTEAKRGSKYHFHRALLLYGIDDFTTTVLAENISRSAAFQLEIEYIEKFNTLHEGYNMSQGGDCGPVRHGDKNGMYGKTHTDDAKRAMSNKKKLLVGELHPHFGKQSKLKGKTYEDIVGVEKAAELKHQRSLTLKGIKRPSNGGDNNPSKRPEVRQKISEAKKVPVEVQGVIYPSKSDACIALNLSLYKLNKLLN